MDNAGANMLKKIPYHLTGNFGLGFLSALACILLLSLGKTDLGFSFVQTWEQLSKGGTLFAGIFAFFAGRYVWISKKHEVEFQKSLKEREERNLRCKLCIELIEAHHKAQYLINVSELDIKAKHTYETRLTSDFENIYKKYSSIINALDVDTFQKIAYLDLTTSNLNYLLEFLRNQLTVAPEEKIRFEEKLSKGLEKATKAAAVLAAIIDAETFAEVMKMESQFIGTNKDEKSSTEKT
ncbi:MAG: hypothetical protein DHS20C02_09600 [Micavibrio sp.]|nr:MAG: hypothetical protein DHS20C02_09600 [Micavibrio sp.]